MTKTLLRLSLVFMFWACETVPDPSSKAYYISSITSNAARQPVSDCTFRYKLDNSYTRLENTIQQEAVRAAFDLWQGANPNIAFVQRQDALVSEIIIRFVSHAEIGNDQQKSIYGLIRGDVSTLSTAREENKIYAILLDSDFTWDSYAITRVVAYHIGIFLGMTVSSDNESMLNPVYVKANVRLSDKDSINANTLYPKPCSSSCNNFLPMKLPVLPEITKSIRVDKQGTISIKATGSMIVGYWLGWSTPVGLEKGIGGIPIGDYSIVRDYWHAVLMYKVNNESSWHSCGTSCEFQTDGVSQCIDLTFAVNDKDLTDNSGAYDVTIDYKK